MKPENPYLVDGRYSFKDLVDIDRLREVFERFTQATGYTTGLVSYPDQELLVSTGWREICTKFHRTFPASSTHCTKSNLELTSYLKKQRELNIHHCENGLVDGATPIIIKDVHVATLATGQILFTKPDYERFKKQGEAYGYDIDAYLEAVGKVPVVTAEEFKKILGFLSEMAVMLAEQGLTNLKSRELAKSARDSEKKFRHLFDHSPTGFYEIDFTTNRFTNVNPAICELTGYSKAELLSMNPFDLITEESRNRFLVGMERMMAGRPAPTNPECRIRDKSGKIHWVQLNVDYKKSEGPFHGVAVIVHDITDRKRTEAAIKLDEERLEAILELHHMIGASEHDITHFAMEAAVRLTGSKIGYLAFADEKETILTMYAWSNSAMRECMIQDKPIVFPVSQTGLWGEAIRQRRPVITNDYTAPNPLKKGYPEGHVPVIRHMNAPLFDGEKIVIVAGVGNKPSDYDKDDLRQLSLLMSGLWTIIRRKRAEEDKEKLQEKLLQSQKMEAVGTLAGGVAHDFNNLLQAIRGYTSLILIGKSETDLDYHRLGEIEKLVERAAQLVKQLLFFGRKAEAERRPVKLDLEVEHAVKILERTIPKMIEIEIFIIDHLWPILADPVQIEQAILNLGSNAADAMAEGGRLVIEAENITMDGESIVSHPGISGNYVLLTVSDTGHGMDKETMGHIFEPFFTTKEIGKGTGLGLASVYGIVKSHGGYITCYSEPDHGTNFKIYLPAIEPREAQATGNLITASPLGGTETILLADDETSIIEVISDILLSFGYKVLTAFSGEEALEIYRAQRDKIDLVILDIGMPGMGGHQCLVELLKTNPAVKVLIASGYSINGRAKKSLEAGAAGYVGKPYQLTDLLNKVRSVMDGK
ncbi:MAG: PocR ligand-binding domain-containing protein [Deltaproteobacteria bacterium]|nr:PocR ligand-binding domain-containing protein [Deltaproteobacteria bacterium]